MIYQSGYLTIKGYDEHFGIYRLGFPNREVEVGDYDSFFVVCRVALQILLIRWCVNWNFIVKTFFYCLQAGRLLCKSGISHREGACGFSVTDRPFYLCNGV